MPYRLWVAAQEESGFLIGCVASTVCVSSLKALLLFVDLVSPVWPVIQRTLTLFLPEAPLGDRVFSSAAEQQEIGGSDGGPDAPATLSAGIDTNMGLDLNAHSLKWDGGIDQHNPLIQSRQRAKMWSDSAVRSHAGVWPGSATLIHVWHVPIPSRVFTCSICSNCSDSGLKFKENCSPILK